MQRNGGHICTRWAGCFGGLGWVSAHQGVSPRPMGAPLSLPPPYRDASLPAASPFASHPLSILQAPVPTPGAITRCVCVFPPRRTTTTSC